jgi:hypothetical protein
MKTITLTIGRYECIQIHGDDIVINTAQDALDMMGNYPADAYIFSVQNFEPDFFDLSTKKLGEIFQKFANYRVKAAIIGDFAQFPSNVLKDFIYETNRQGEFLLVSSIDEVKSKWQ